MVCGTKINQFLTSRDIKIKKFFSTFPIYNFSSIISASKKLVYALNSLVCVQSQHSLFVMKSITKLYYIHVTSFSNISYCINCE